MNAPEFAAWIAGINTVLNGQAPSPELWKQISDEAAKLAPAPVPRVAAPVMPAPNLVDYVKQQEERNRQLPPPLGAKRWLGDPMYSLALKSNV